MYGPGTSRCAAKTSAAAPYRASDPTLLAWVHAAEIQAFLWAYQAYGESRLDDADADT